MAHRHFTLPAFPQWALSLGEGGLSRASQLYVSLPCFQSSTDSAPRFICKCSCQRICSESVSPLSTAEEKRPWPRLPSQDPTIFFSPKLNVSQASYHHPTVLKAWSLGQQRPKKHHPETRQSCDAPDGPNQTLVAEASANPAEKRCLHVCPCGITKWVWYASHSWLSSGIGCAC